MFLPRNRASISRSSRIHGGAKHETSKVPATSRRHILSSLHTDPRNGALLRARWTLLRLLILQLPVESPAENESPSSGPWRSTLKFVILNTDLATRIDPRRPGQRFKSALSALDAGCCRRHSARTRQPPRQQAGGGHPDQRRQFRPAALEQQEREYYGADH